MRNFVKKYKFKNTNYHRHFFIKYSFIKHYTFRTEHAGMYTYLPFSSEGKS